MFYNKKLRIGLAVFGAFALLAILMSLFASTSALALTSISNFDSLLVPKQDVEFYDAAGSQLGSGFFRANVSTDRNGRITGSWTRIDFVVWTPASPAPDTLDIKFTSVNEVIGDVYGNPIGVVLSGRGTLVGEGQTQTLSISATIRGDASAPEITILDISDYHGQLIPLTFTANGRLRFRE